VCCAPAPKPHGVSKTAECLPYPEVGIRPRFGSELSERPSLRLSVDGRFVALNDYGRLVVWGAGGSAPILYPDSGTLHALTRYGGAYGVGHFGQLIRTDLHTGFKTTGADMHLFPSRVRSANVDPSGRYLAVTRSEGPKKNEVLVIDDCLLQDRKDKTCDDKAWDWPVRTDAEWAWSAYRQGEVIFAMEDPGPGKPSEVVLRRVPTGERLGGWANQFFRLIVTREYAVEWDDKAGKLVVRKLAEPTLTAEVDFGEAYASSDLPCYGVEAGADNLVVVRRDTSCGLGKGAWVWAVIDVDKRQVLWRTTERVGAITVGPERRLYMATERGVCMSRIGE